MAAVTRQATGNGANTGSFTFTGGASLWQSINDSSDSTFIVGVANGYCTFTFAAFTVPSIAIIDSIKIAYRHRSTTTSNAYAHGACIKVGATYYGRGAGGGTTNWDAGAATGTASSGGITARTYTSTVNPATGVAWTRADVNALAEFGVSSDDFNPDANFYQIDITVTYHAELVLLPNASGTYSAFSVFGGSYDYQVLADGDNGSGVKIDPVPDNNTYEHSVNFQNHTTQSGTITLLEITNIVALLPHGGYGDYSERVYTHSNEYAGNPFATNPFTSAAWTWAEVDAVESIVRFADAAALDGIEWRSSSIKVTYDPPDDSGASIIPAAMHHLKMLRG